ncbi:hypothetical protein M9458_017712, partial [Cirrhinus mrigala]
FLPCFIALFYLLLLDCSLGILTFCLFSGFCYYLCPGYYCLFGDRPCLSDYVVFNKSSHLDLSRFIRVPLQNTLPPHRSSSFWTQPTITMDPASRFVQLRQGNWPIEQYVMDFCELCHLVDFKESFLKDIFFYGLCKDISNKMAGHHRHWSLVHYTDFALLLSGSAFTVGIADDKPWHSPVSATPRNSYVMSGIVTIIPEPSHAKPAKPKPVHVMSSKPKPAQVTSTKPQPAHAMPAAPGPAHAMPAAPGPAHAMPAAPEPVHKMAAIPKPVHKMAAPSESPAKMAAASEPHHAKIISS